MVDATLACSLSAGVSYPKVFRGADLTGGLFCSVLTVSTKTGQPLLGSTDASKEFDADDGGCVLPRRLLLV